MTSLPQLVFLMYCVGKINSLLKKLTTLSAQSLKIKKNLVNNAFLIYIYILFNLFIPNIHCPAQYKYRHLA